MKTEQEVRDRLEKLKTYLKRSFARELGVARDIERETLKEWIRELKWVLDYPQEELEKIPPQYYGTDDPSEAEWLYQKDLEEVRRKYGR
jgi:hypothetical protein